MITIRANMDHTEVRVTFPYSAERVALVKDLLNPEPVYIEKKFSHWRLPLNDDAEEKLRSILSGEVQTGKEEFDIHESALSVFEVKREWSQENLRMSELRSPDSDWMSFKMDEAKLNDLERTGVAYIMRNMRGVIVNDPENMSRIKQTLAAVDFLGSIPVLIVCATVDRPNWVGVLKNILPQKFDVRAIRSKGDLSKEPLSAYTLINYDLLSAQEDYLKSLEWNAVIFDKCENLRSEKANWTRAAERIAQQIRHKIALSSFDLPNSPDELISILRVIGRLEDMGGFWWMANHYCAAKKAPLGWDLSGRENIEELRRELKKTCYIRRV